MKLLKKILLLGPFALLAYFNVSAQTIPFSFKSQKINVMALRLLNENAPNIRPSTDLIKSDSITEDLKFKTPKSAKIIAKVKRKYYIELANRLNKKADTLENKNIENYKKSLTGINIPDPSNLNLLSPQLETIEQTKDDNVAAAALLRNVSKQAIYTARTSGNFKAFFVKNSSDAQMYYNAGINDSKSKFLNNSLITFGSDGKKVSIYNELYADFYGPLRVGFGALISNNQNETSNSPIVDPTTNAAEMQKNAVQRLLGGGGNGVFNMSYPIANFQSYDNSFFIKFIAAPKLGVDIPKIGSESDKYSFNWDPGFEGSLFYTGELNVLTLYSNFRFGVIGGNSSFYDNLLKTDKKSFVFNQLSFGFAINSTFRLSYNIYYGSGFVRNNFPSTVSFTIIPN